MCHCLAQEGGRMYRPDTNAQNTERHVLHLIQRNQKER